MLSLVLPRLGSSDLIMAVGETARTATVEELAMNNYDVPYGTDLADAFRLTVDHLEGLSGFVRVLMVISSPPTITRSREGHRLFNWPPLAEAAAATAEQAARLAAYYSQARGTTTAPVDYTLQKHVRHMKGGGPGMVIYEREKTIYVAPEDVSVR